MPANALAPPVAMSSAHMMLTSVTQPASCSRWGWISSPKIILLPWNVTTLLPSHAVDFGHQYLTNEKPTLVQVMAWCRQATSHYLSQCWRSRCHTVSIGHNKLKRLESSLISLLKISVLWKLDELCLCRISNLNHPFKFHNKNLVLHNCHIYQ